MSQIATLIMQIVTILLVSSGIGRLCKRFHQPRVIGEMLAGILLGPSLLGWVAPGVADALFPTSSLAALNALSQIGLLVFMFVVGLELNPDLLKGHGRTVLLTSQVSTVAPALLGLLLALYLYPRLSSGQVRFRDFALFLAISMSITAFPMLARILADHRLNRTEVGVLAIASAALGDATSWLLLVIVVVLARVGHLATMSPWVTVFGSLAYVGMAVFLLKPALAWMVRRSQSSGANEVAPACLLAAFSSALITEWLGLHAVFGAFLIGALMPKEGEFARALKERLEGVTLLLLPLFFATTGLRTSVALLSGAEMWFYCGLVVAVAIIGKVVGTMIATRASGLGWRESGAIGVLMNTRGLIGLVVFNIGLEIGVISPALFTILVLMALVTTFMAGPLIELIYPKRISDQEPASVAAEVAA